MTIDEAIRIIKIVLVVAEEFEITVQGEEFTKEKCKEAVEIVTNALDQEPCADAISRQAAIDAINHAQVNFSVVSEIDFTKHEREVHEIIENVLGAQEKALKELPPVTPAEKVGRWIYEGYYKCSECGKTTYSHKTNYCPNCGAKMGGDAE